MSSGAATQATFAGSGRRVNVSGNSSNARFARFLDRTSPRGRGGTLSAAQLRRFRG